MFPLLCRSYTLPPVPAFTCYGPLMSTIGNPLHPMNLIKQSAFWAIHLGCFAVIWVGFSWTAFWVCLALYVVRMFGITGVYHRYFSHRSYKTSRWFQFVLAFVGATSAQKGPMWWASHHRHHHQHSDTEEDIHPPRVYGLWWAHVGWVLSTQFIETRWELVKDLARFPEIRLLDKYHIIPPLLLLGALWIVGSACEVYYPQLGTSASQLIVWGFCISTTLLYHGTFCINSLAHLIGRPRFKTGDDSKNSFLLALITLGEGWHNNHHRYPGSERQGFYWWEIDISHYILRCLSFFGLVWELREPPARIYQEAAQGS
jgi:stearoyl-CoA desaturase (delta-9 desaturase)